MSAGHLLFAIVITAYIFMGVAFEERDLRKVLGKDYEQYRRSTPKFMPMPKRQGVAAEHKP